MISRRFFLAATASFALAPKFVAASDEVPKMLDHILLGCNDLDRGIDFVEKHTGVRAAFGGVHPGRGTRNALLSLGERHYLEIIAPDPQQPGAPDHYGLLKLTEPRLVGWAAHPGDLNELATRLRNANIPFDGPNPGSRKRPDGRLLQWKTLNLKDDHDGLLPFFIEWSADTIHPSADSPAGCRIVRFEIATPEPEQLSKTVAILDLDVKIAKADKAQLRATIAGSKGELALTS
jgi:catechol 2,3-dioxygenase-like lactoylglutathione lyase family enzyme